MLNAKKTIDEIVNWLKDLQKTSNLKGVVIGISGGKDSAVAAALCCKAFGKENVVGILMPNGYQSDIDDSLMVCKHLDIDYEIMNIRDVYKTFKSFFKNCQVNISKPAKINIPPRLRMTVLYTYAQSLHYRVCGTGNLSEIMLGYFTKWGDGACDFNPIGSLTSVEVVVIGDELNLPKKIIHKIPSDGLCGMTDEENLGILYEDVHRYIRGEGGVPDSIKKKIEARIRLGKHKVVPIPIPVFGLGL